MRKLSQKISMVVFVWVWVCLCSLFFWSVEARNLGYAFTIQNDANFDTVYRVDDIFDHFAFLAEKNSLQKSHGAAENSPAFYEIDKANISKLLDETNSYEAFIAKIRITLVQSLMQEGYSNLIDKPYGKEGNNAIIVSWSDFIVNKNIEKKDNLDTLIEKTFLFFSWDFTEIKKYKELITFQTLQISTEDIKNIWAIYLFKTEQDLRDLWYQLISRRTRVNTDKDYRRHNIKTAFANIWNVRMILPQETFSLQKEFHYRPGNTEGKAAFVSGYAIFWNSERLVYGGWLCGVATAFYQWTLSNKWLQIIERKGHSIWYRNLYEASINGNYETTPWIDATVYSLDFDVKAKNISKSPILMVFNFDGEAGHEEQLFTLWQEENQWSFAFVGKQKKSWWTCYTRNINGKNTTSCYRKLQNF